MNSQGASMKYLTGRMKQHLQVASRRAEEGQGTSNCGAQSLTRLFSGVGSESRAQWAQDVVHLN